MRTAADRLATERYQTVASRLAEDIERQSGRIKLEAHSSIRTKLNDAVDRIRTLEAEF